jgi:YVTN family beta-propeller protein
MKVLRVAGAALATALLLLWTACGETYRPVANPIIPSQPNPAFSHVVLVLSDNGPNNPGASTTIDVSGDTAESQSQTGLQPVYAAVVGGSNVYVANSMEDTISAFGVATPAPVATISLPSSCGSPPCSMPVFVGGTETATIYVAESKANMVAAISTNTSVITNNVTVGTNPVALAETPDQNKVYVANQGTNGSGGSVTVINTQDKSVVANPPLAGFGWISPVWIVARSDSQRIYVLDQGSGLVAAIDTSFDAVVSSVSVGAGANLMVYDPNLNRIYVVNPVANTVTSLDASTDTLPATAVSITNPKSVAPLPDGSRFYISSATVSGGIVTSILTVINAADFTIKTTIPLASVQATCAVKTWAELPVAAAADSSRVYVGNCDAGNITDIQTSNDRLLLQIPAPVSAAAPSTVSITGALQSGVGTTYTYTLISGAPLRVGMRIGIQSMVDAVNNGTFSIIALGAGSFTVINQFGVTAASQHGTGIASTAQNPVFVVAGP